MINFKDINEILEVNGDRTDNIFSIYKRHLLQVIILETLLSAGPTTSKDLVFVIARMHRNNRLIMWRTTMPDTAKEIHYLTALELVKTKQVDQLLIEFSITEKGKDILRNGIIHNLAYNAFSSHRSSSLSVWSIIISVGSAIVAIIALWKQK
ncbi:hypothetical protein [Fibrella forsythiae]|uniref:MarR family transcriptional regulator n=1 Tax=Fibrella forsythiae TaxID=2817061 RepID=A0ABS3JUX2_9BACT|nr:hypothetical protein [Fibrella forsythiae]MBO0953263.1 hypothetical protein [Fibrella forsythiae]